MKIACTLFLTILIYLLSAGNASSQVPVFPGSCPTGSSPVAQPNDNVPHYTFPAVAPSDGHPGLDVAITVWRIPCGNTGHFSLWVRMSDAGMLPGSLRPKISVYQDGAMLGWFGTEVRKTPAGHSYSYGSGFQWGSNLFQTGSIQGRSQTEALVGMTIFLQPARAFTFRVRDTLDWPESTPDLVYEIPGVNGVSQPSQVPEGIAGLWMNPDEPGWGVLIDRNAQGIVFAAMLTYDDDGNTTWIPMTRGELNGKGEVVGDAFAVRGSPFSKSPDSPEFHYEMRGRFALTFESSFSARIHWTFNGRTTLSNIRKLLIKDLDGNECVGTPSVHGIENLPGWGAQFQGSHGGPGCGVHATLLTYDASGRPIWLFAALQHDTSSTGEHGDFAVSGFVYRPKGSPYGQPHDHSRFILGDPVGEWRSQLVTPSSPSKQMQIGIGGTKRSFVAKPFLF